MKKLDTNGITINPGVVGELEISALVEAIVLQAVQDYKLAISDCKSIVGRGLATPEYKDYLRRETEGFFKSGWFFNMTNVDGGAFFKRLTTTKTRVRRPYQTPKTKKDEE